MRRLRRAVQDILAHGRSTRVRLTLWYLGVLLGTMLIFTAAMYVELARHLRGEIDGSLLQVAESVVDGDDEQLILNFDALLPGHVASLYQVDGQPLSTIGAGRPLPLPDLAIIAAATRGQQVWRSAPVQGASWRIFTRAVTTDARVVAVLQVARSEAPVAALIEELREMFTTLVPIVLVLAAASGLFLAGRAFAAVDRITRTAAAISPDDLTKRLPDELSRAPGEVGRLARTFNRMLDRLERAFQRQRQFTADASHELRTPLTLLLGQVDVALQRPRSPGEYQHALTAAREDIVRMRRLLDVMLVLARADARQEVLAHEPIELSELVQVVADAMAGLAEERGVRLDVRPTTPIVVQGDQARLMQLLVNLVENALKHTPPGGAVSIAASRAPDAHSAVVSVRDTGSGISPEHLPHIFERFYRVDPARTAGGAGLGLAISNWIVQAHGGRIEVESKVGIGSTFHIWLPRTPAVA